MVNKYCYREECQGFIISQAITKCSVCFSGICINELLLDDVN